MVNDIEKILEKYGMNSYLNDDFLKVLDKEFTDNNEISILLSLKNSAKKALNSTSLDSGRSFFDSIIKKIDSAIESFSSPFWIEFNIVNINFHLNFLVSCNLPKLGGFVEASPDDLQNKWIVMSDDEKRKVGCVLHQRGKVDKDTCFFVPETSNNNNSIAFGNLITVLLFLYIKNKEGKLPSSYENGDFVLLVSDILNLGKDSKEGQLMPESIKKKLSKLKISSLKDKKFAFKKP
jgi:hypothetical protein